jgi:hypothetical protein
MIFGRYIEPGMAAQAAAGPGAERTRTVSSTPPQTAPAGAVPQPQNS